MQYALKCRPANKEIACTEEKIKAYAQAAHKQTSIRKSGDFSVGILLSKTV